MEKIKNIVMVLNRIVNKRTLHCKKQTTLILLDHTYSPSTHMQASSSYRCPSGHSRGRQSEQNNVVWHQTFHI